MTGVLAGVLSGVSGVSVRSMVSGEKSSSTLAESSAKSSMRPRAVIIIFSNFSLICFCLSILVLAAMNTAEAERVLPMDCTRLSGAICFLLFVFFVALLCSWGFTSMIQTLCWDPVITERYLQ